MSKAMLNAAFKVVNLAKLNRAIDFRHCHCLVLNRKGMDGWMDGWSIYTPQSSQEASNYHERHPRIMESRLRFVYHHSYAVLRLKL
jgi:hypothetical protein